MLALAWVSCAPEEGGAGQACHPNETCNTGLSCLDKVCVMTGGAGGNVGGGNVGGGNVGGGSGGGGGDVGGGTGGSGGGSGGGGAGGGDGMDAGAPDAGCSTGAATCGTPTDCAPPPTSCLASSCADACCGTTNVAARTPCADGTGTLCDGLGQCVQCLVPEDCSPTGTACRVNTCTAGVCGTRNATLGTSCSDSGGLVCDGLGTCTATHCMDLSRDADETDVDCGGASCTTCGAGSQCQVPRDCQSGVCSALVCQNPTCSDSVQNGIETDIDCGALCPKCATTKKCLGNADCLTGACDAVSLTCVANQCIDHRTDGAETGLDCGGGTCPGCTTGSGCSLNTDCGSNACDAVSLTCVSNQCDDNRKDGSETDLDCGGGTCSACATGKLCALNTDCASNTCHTVSHTCIASNVGGSSPSPTHPDVLAIQRIFIEYFGRPAGAVELQSWVQVLANQTGSGTPRVTALNSIRTSAGNSAEFRSLVGVGSGSVVVTQVFTNMFGHSPDTAALTFWNGQLSGGASLAVVVQSIGDGALSGSTADGTTFANRINAAGAFTLALDTAAEVTGYSGASATACGRRYIATVTTTSSYVTATSEGWLTVTVSTCTQ